MEDMSLNSHMEDMAPSSPRFSISELELAAQGIDIERELLGPDPPAAAAPQGDNRWVTFEAEVRSAAASALNRVRNFAGERCAELLRLLEIEEQTRCHAFQETQLGEVRPAVYQHTVRSILEKLLGKLETMGTEPALYQGAAQCLSEYMSALNHHSDLCASVQYAPKFELPAIVEGVDYGESASDLYSERSEDTDTLSVTSDHVMGGGADGSFVNGYVGASFGGGAIDLSELRKERRRESNKKAATKYRTKKTVVQQHVIPRAPRCASR